MNVKRISYSIAPEIFEMFPGYMRGVVVAEGVVNGESPKELTALLRAAEKEVRAELDPDTILEHPQMASWREAYRRFGAKPGKHRPSMEAMARRVLRGQALPGISRLVDIGNIVSLRHTVPVGGHAIDVVDGDLALRVATGDEVFVPFGSDRAESPGAGEVVFCEGNTVLTRRWTWRQANHTLVTPATTALEVNVDGLPPATRSKVEDACRDVAGLIEKFCGGRLRYTILTAEKRDTAIAAGGQ